MKCQSKVEDAEEQWLPLSSPRKDCTLGLMKALTALVVFMGGVVFGLSLCAGLTTRYYSSSSSSSSFSSSQAEAFLPRRLYSANCDKDYTSVKYFIKPRQLDHDMTDDELFWRASMVPKRVEYPYKRVPKVAFLFLTRGPLPLAPLWDRFFRGHEPYFSVYVHAPPGYELNVSESSAFYRRQIPSQLVSWGKISLVDAEKRLLANALLDFSNERFVLLSESCIPVYNFPMVYHYLMNSAQSYVESYDQASKRGRGRYSFFMYPDITVKQWRKGSEWFEMNREMAVIVVAESKYYRIFKRYCRPSCYPDEHYIPTYLNMFHGNLNSNRSLTWVDWSRGGPHPAMFNGDEINADFIQTIRNNGTICKYNNHPTSVCYLFARKFAPSALEPLLNISSTIMKY